MKNLFLKLAIVAIFFAAAPNDAKAQTEIGVRWGELTGGDFGVDALIGVGKFSRVHATASFGGGSTSFGIDALWDFIYRPLGGEAFMWYAGAGPFLGFGDKFSLGAAGEIGLEYKFNFPMSVSMDFRPAFRLVEDTDFTAGFGLNVRYILNNGAK
jgi:hypothetical protein